MDNPIQSRARKQATTKRWAIQQFWVSVLRESIRLSNIEVSQLYARHADAAAVGGLTLFLVFVVINAALIVTCVWLVRRSLAA